MTEKACFLRTKERTEGRLSTAPRKRGIHTKGSHVTEINDRRGERREFSRMKKKRKVTSINLPAT